MAIPAVRNLCGVNSVWISAVSHPARSENLVESVAPHSAAILLNYPAISSRYSIGGIYWSYTDKPPSDANVTVTTNPGGLVFKAYIFDGGPGFAIFDPPLTTSKGASVAIVLSGGGGKRSTLMANLWTYATDPYEWI